MAHADYHCCLICDCKKDYSGGDASTKESPCMDCIERMQSVGGPVITSQEKLKAAVEERGKDALKWLHDIGYSPCYYDNPIDDYLFEKGLCITEEGGTPKWGRKLKPLI